MQLGMIGQQLQTSDAETTPLRAPELYQYKMDLPEVAEVWRRGSLIDSCLLDLTAGALLKDPQLDAFGGHLEKPAEEKR
ncbi:hypothetical protein [Granulosicoccus antarcticus]|uniref:6-phosphogluconate dehydrogenase, NAD(+)-dependent, decarboxylating n=1 Tax=Granulosicoccus antarcticus IMCC3135 TaxID=1192854 RepID=A0A2Z2NP08_9GAMM|nr:hypothetical protein [Granulosicoccus antarcticus]ASJ72265.1 6-phosphogluconate dehydrogenase, NAD(+)-dependent, decarboxylating [Granulosicoccus antarcticus IMCC3135]